jgi:hypothetical protein
VHKTVELRVIQRKIVEVDWRNVNRLLPRMLWIQSLFNVTVGVFIGLGLSLVFIVGHKKSPPKESEDVVSAAALAPSQTTESPPESLTTVHTVLPPSVERSEIATRKGAQAVLSTANIENPLVRFLDFEHFKKFGKIPRYPDDHKDVPVVSFTKINRRSSLLVFISHRWLQGTKDDAEPDNEMLDHYNLIVEGVQMLKDTYAAKMDNVYLWIDFGCVDQNGDTNPTKFRLVEVMSVCDLMLTPIYDPDPCSWRFEDSATQSVLENYVIQEIEGDCMNYLARSWCRLEMYLCAHVPFWNPEASRIAKFGNALQFAHLNNRRPHFFYGTKVENDLPIMLPPLSQEFLLSHDPIKGTIGREEDKDAIIEFMKLCPPAESVVGYTGGVSVSGQREGFGKMVFENGSMYVGEWEHDQPNGKGVMTTVAGNKYKGHFKNGKYSGEGIYFYANGSIFAGTFIDDVPHGHIVKLNESGVVTFDGNYDHGHRIGTQSFQNEPPTPDGKWRQKKRTPKAFSIDDNRKNLTEVQEFFSPKRQVLGTSIIFSASD